MNERLKRNILNLDGVVQFMTNSDALKQKGIWEEMLEKFSPVLQYACIYWARHLNEANVDNADLINKLKIFADDHLLHWIEGVGWIGSKISFRLYLDSIQNFTMGQTTLLELRELLSDALRFIFKFFPLIETSALFTYRLSLLEFQTCHTLPP